jgi:hypothetical protein
VLPLNGLTLAFLVFTHVDTGHGIFIIKEYSANARQSGFTNTSCSKECAVSLLVFHVCNLARFCTASLTASIFFLTYHTLDAIQLPDAIVFHVLLVAFS